MLPPDAIELLPNCIGEVKLTPSGGVVVPHAAPLSVPVISTLPSRSRWKISPPVGVTSHSPFGVVIFTSGEAWQQAADEFGTSAVDEAALTLQVPTDGSVASLRSLLDRLDGVAVDGIALHTPDLADVFLALTGEQRETEAVA